MTLRDKLRKDAKVAKKTIENREVVTREDGRRVVRRAKSAAGRAGSATKKLANRASKNEPDGGPDDDGMWEGAEAAASMRGPIDATMDPTTAPEQTGFFAMRSSGEDGEMRVDDLVTGGGDGDGDDDADATDFFHLGGDGEGGDNGGLL